MNNTDLPICNGHMLTEAMEKGYYWNEFLASVGIVEIENQEKLCLMQVKRQKR